MTFHWYHFRPEFHNPQHQNCSYFSNFQFPLKTKDPIRCDNKKWTSICFTQLLKSKADVTSWSDWCQLPTAISWILSAQAAMQLQPLSATHRPLFNVKAVRCHYVHPLEGNVLLQLDAALERNKIKFNLCFRYTRFVVGSKSSRPYLLYFLSFFNNCSKSSFSLFCKNSTLFCSYVF